MRGLYPHTKDSNYIRNEYKQLSRYVVQGLVDLVQSLIVCGTFNHH